jgi:elongation factor Ts
MSSTTGYQPSAADVKALRERTGLPMMECKKALAESQGDAELAIDILRKRGEQVRGGKVGRETSQGRIELYRDPAGRVIAMVQMKCEQAPSAKNEKFVAMTKALAKQAALQPTDPTPQNLLEQPDVDRPSQKAGNWLLEVVNLIRENMGVARVARLAANGGVLGGYVHHSYQESALVRLEGSGATPELANDIAMHAVAAKPMAIRREDISPSLVDKEREIAREQAAQTGKPANILDKIAEGKLNTWFGEKVLLEQIYAKGDNKAKVRDVLKQAGGVTVTDLVRFKVGEESTESQQ